MLDWNTLTVKHIGKFNDIVLFSYGHGKFQFEELADEDYIVVLNRKLESMGTLSICQYRGKNYAERKIDSENDVKASERVFYTIHPSDSNTTMVAVRIDLSVGLKNVLLKCALQWLDEIRLLEPSETRKVILSEISEQLDRWALFTLKSPIDVLQDQYSDYWGHKNDELTEQVFWQNQTPINKHDLLYSKTHIAINALNALCHEFKTILLREQESILAPTVDEVGNSINNGLFYYGGKMQVSAIRRFFEQNKYLNIDPKDIDEWTGLLSGTSVPSKPLRWLGPKTHLSYLLIYAVKFSETQKHNRQSLTIMPVQTRVPWNQLGKYIEKSDGERLSSKDGTKNLAKFQAAISNPYIYITNLIEKQPS
jgi:hypothetical protein